MSRIIGLDIGEKRIGVSISDETKTIATGFKTVFVKSIRQSIEEIKDIVKKYGADEIVVGMPLNMNGSSGPAAQKIISFCDRLKDVLSVKISTFDERLTTKQGEGILLQADTSRKKRRLKIDKIASQIILQTYLDYKKFKTQS